MTTITHGPMPPRRYERGPNGKLIKPKPVYVRCWAPGCVIRSERGQCSKHPRGEQPLRTTRNGDVIGAPR